MKCIDQAIADFTEAIRLDPNYANAYNNRGLAYDDKGDFARAIEDYTQAIRFEPRHVNAHTNRGADYAETGQFDKAIADYNEAIKIDPDYASAYSTGPMLTPMFGRFGPGDRGLH